MRESLKRPLHRYLANRRRSPLVRKIRQYAYTLINWIDNFEYDVELNGERYVLEKLRPEIIFDVGANAGQWARMAADACPSSQIHCFEIVPDTFERLKTVARPNIALNNFGLSDETGTVNVRCFEGQSETATMYDYPGKPGGRDVPCQVMLGDEYMAANGIERVGFLKMDVEGAEMRVLKGFARALAEKRIDAIQFEYVCRR